jgi:hypothetical protein
MVVIRLEDVRDTLSVIRERFKALGRLNPGDFFYEIFKPYVRKGYNGTLHWHKDPTNGGYIECSDEVLEKITRIKGPYGAVFIEMLLAQLEGEDSDLRK